MPRFFFHLISPGHRAVDDEGSEFGDVEAAYLDAYEAALEIAFEMLREHRDPGNHQFEICDDQGRFLLEVPFSEVLRPSKRAIPPSVIHGKVHESMERSRELQSAIRQEFAQTQRVLKDTRATMKRSRAHR